MAAETAYHKVELEKNTTDGGSGVCFFYKMCFQNKLLAIFLDYLIICMHYSATAFHMCWNCVNWDWAWRTGDQ